MSWQATTAVAKNSRAKGSDRLVLLCIANYAQGDGGGCWPSVATLCADTLLGRRNVQYTVRRLQRLGELEVQTGAGPGGANLYRILLPMPSAGRTRRKGAQSLRPLKSD